MRSSDRWPRHLCVFKRLSKGTKQLKAGYYDSNVIKLFRTGNGRRRKVSSNPQAATLATASGQPRMVSARWSLW